MGVTTYTRPVDAGWRVAATVVLLAVMVLFSGCTRAAGPKEVVLSPGDTQLLGSWQDASGADVPDGTNASDGILVLQAGAGSITCSETHGTVFLTVAWPAGRRLDWKQPTQDGDFHVYIRDPQGSDWAVGQSDLDTELPKTAVSSGLGRAGNTLYTIGTAPAAIWVTRADGHVERWAEVKAGKGCG